MEEYSPLIKSLQYAFNNYAKAGMRSLLVYWQGWGESVVYMPVQKGQYPWALHDHYMANDDNASILAFAFDLQSPFKEQVPENMRCAKTLEGFAFTPEIHIPDRTGHIPAKLKKQAQREILYPKPKLVVG